MKIEINHSTGIQNKRITTGHVNQVYLMNGYIVKKYCNDHFMPKRSLYRLNREKAALKRYGGIIAPHFIKEYNNQLFMEYIHGELLETIVEESNVAYYCQRAGEILQMIHKKTEFSANSFRQRFERQIEKDTLILAELLRSKNIVPDIHINWEIVKKIGITRVHRDFHFGNIVKGAEGLRVIDWESSGIGSPYEDFAYVELWIFQQYEHREDFFKGYGKNLDAQTIKAFLKAKSLQNLARLVSYNYVPTDMSKFYYNKFLKVLSENW